MEEKDVNGVEDRIMHLFLNMRGFSYWDEANSHLKHGLKRAYMEGLYEGIRKAKGK